MAERIDFSDQISRNKFKSFFLMIGIFIVIVVLGYVISMATEPGLFFTIMILATIISILYVWISYYNSDKIAIASVGAKEASRTQHKDYYNLVEGLTLASGLPMPKIYIMPSSQINAFATGRDPSHAVICVTEGALQKLEKNQRPSS